VSPDDALAREVESIREEYRRRSVAPQVAGSYSFLNPAHAFLVLERERAILHALGRHLGRGLAEVDVLDVGSGQGTSLAFLAAYGADPSRLHGADIAEDRIERGRELYPQLDLRVSDGVTLPYEDASFDVVQQITMLSSVHSDDLRRAIAREMLRVLRPGGLVLSFDVAPVPVAPRVLNRLLSRRVRAPQAPSADAGAPAVQLTPVRPLDEPELRTLFAPAEPVATVPLTPYRPLVERFSARPLALALLSTRPFATTLLYLARA
jgi:ubiquinone/menaquinone biosynthesis C-methylase UbiE